MLLELLAGQIGLYEMLVWLVALILAVTVHEFAHAFVAEKLGDNTARLLGRVTLNPLAHLDPLGTLMILLTRFGWGRPVPINPLNFENPLRDGALVSLAGPAANLVTASLLAIPVRLDLWWGALLLPLIFLNVGLAVFNLLPVFPLDGFKVVEGVLPLDLAAAWQKTAPYGFYLIVFLVLFPLGNFSLLSSFVLPLAQTILRILLGS